MKVYIIDIDGTIWTEYYLKDGSQDYKKAKPIKERVAKINNLFKEGNEIHYWTARGTVTRINHYDLTLNQLKKWNCKFHSLSVGEKPNYDLLICDKTKRIEEIKL